MEKNLMYSYTKAMGVVNARIAGLARINGECLLTLAPIKCGRPRDVIYGGRLPPLPPSPTMSQAVTWLYLYFHVTLSHGSAITQFGCPNMRDAFPGYFRPNDEEFKELWEECMFVLDANILLNLYRYTPDKSEELLEILGQLSERLWIPHQAAEEYLRNRLEVMILPHNSGHEDKSESCTLK